MRHCFNEKPEVYEAEGQDLAELLRDVATFIETLPYGSPSLRVHPYTDENGEFTHLATLYVS